MNHKKKIKNYIAREEGLEVSKLFLYGDISDMWDEDISARSVQRELAYIGGRDVEVHINSYGGDLFEGIAIYNLLKAYSGKVTTVIDGVAASAASVIAMAGETVRMPKNTQLLIHNPWTIAAGNAKELRKAADDLEKAQLSLEECYVEKFSGSREELQALLAEDKYLTASEAFGLGLCTELLGDEENATEALVVTQTKVIDEEINRILEALAEKLQVTPIEQTVETPEKTENKILKMFAKENKR